MLLWSGLVVSADRGAIPTWRAGAGGNVPVMVVSLAEGRSDLRPHRR
jgi:hypothetical protein